MIDTDLIVKVLQDHGHTVKAVVPVPENAGEYEFSINGNLLSLAETRLLLEREDEQNDEQNKGSEPSPHSSDPSPLHGSDRIPTP